MHCILPVNLFDIYVSALSSIFALFSDKVCKFELFCNMHCTNGTSIVLSFIHNDYKVVIVGNTLSFYYVSL